MNDIPIIQLDTYRYSSEVVRMAEFINNLHTLESSQSSSNDDPGSPISVHSDQNPNDTTARSIASQYQERRSETLAGRIHVYVDTDDEEEEGLSYREFGAVDFANNEDSDTDWDEGAYKRSWKVEHSGGDRRLKARDFINTTERHSFDSTRALDMLHRLYTINYGSKNGGSRAARSSDTYRPLFFLDYISIIGQPLQPLTRRTDRFFDNVTVTFQNWQAPYAGKHVQELRFELEHRTFRLATAATRETWFIVMHPKELPDEELDSPRQEPKRANQKTKKSSALQEWHAQALADYIKDVFLDGHLLGEGVEPSWGLNRPASQTITSNKWTSFQVLFIERWPQFVEQQNFDLFWTKNEPAFHAYDYGANIQIEVDDELGPIPQETWLRPVDDVSSEEEEDDDDEEEEEEGQGQVLERHASPGADYHLDSTTRANYEAPFGEGLQKLQTGLEDKYELKHIHFISYALAVDIHCSDSSTEVDESNEPARCLLANRNNVASEYASSQDYTFFPLAFHQAYGNFSSSKPPRFLSDGVLTVIEDNMKFQNGEADVLSFGYFQGYSNLKRSIRHSPDNLLVDKGYSTAALTLPAPDALDAKNRSIQQRLLKRVQGQLTPDNPGASKPFAREQQRISASIDAEEFAFRMEQVVTVDASKLVPEHLQFATVLRPILQLIRFFLENKDGYVTILHSFPPSIFPKILHSFSRVFELAMDEMHERFEKDDCKGLGMALSEGVAAIDRLGSYCYTGFGKALTTSVLRPLGTIDSIRKGAWPYIDPRILDLRGKKGTFNAQEWPRDVKGRPVLMHTAALSYHYGPDVSASRHSNLWFRELGGASIQGPTSAAQFLEDIFRELWTMQMKTFMNRQLERQLRQDENGSPRHVALQRWLQADHPFSNQSYATLVSPTVDGTALLKDDTHITKTRSDFADELYQACVEGQAGRKDAYCPRNATWFFFVQAAITYTQSGYVSKEQWIGGLVTAMHNNRIEWVPGPHRTKLAHNRIVRLVGTTQSKLVSEARLGSLKRKAIEAQLRSANWGKKRRIDFGSPIPFRAIPAVVKKGFEKQIEMFEGKNESIREHYQVARSCLVKSLGDPVCDVMLMMVLTLCASSVTPCVPPQKRYFDKGKPKDTGIFGANLVTRMLWFLEPRMFPWEKDEGKVLCVREMTKKIVLETEHKGVNNRMLRELEWVRVKGERDSPRNSDLTLEDRATLKALRKDLIALMDDADRFIGRIFRSFDRIWVERCSSIIREAAE